MANEVKLKIAMDGTAEVVAGTERISTGFDKLGTQAHAAGKSSDTLRNALTGIATLATAVAIIRMADAVTTLRTQLNLSAGSAQQAAQAYESLFQIAQKSRVSFTELGTTYAAIARAGNEMGVSQTRLLAVTQSISQAMTIGGGSAASMQAALVQLGQGLSSGTLRGEELNSIMEQTPRLAKAIADGMGVPIGELRKLGETGQLTAQQVISALEKSGPQLAKEMASATVTVGQAFTMMGNSATKMVGEMDAASGATASLASAMQSMSGAMDSVGAAIKKHETAFAIVTSGIAGAAAVAGVAALGSALYAAVPAVVAFGAAWLATPLAPIILALAAVAAGVMALKAAADAGAKSVTGMGYALADLDDRIGKFEVTYGARTAEGIKRLAAMRAERARLQGELAQLGAKGLDTRAEDARFGASTAVFKEREKVAKEYQELKQELSGVNKEFQTHLKQLQAMRDAGLIDEKKYVADVIELIAKEGGARKAAAKPEQKADAWQADVARTYTNALEDLNKEQLKATAVAEGYSKTQEILRGVMASPEWAGFSRRKQEEVILAASLAQAEEDRADATVKAKKAADDYISSLNSSASSVEKKLVAMRDETAAYAVAVQNNISLEEAIDRVAITRLEEQRVMELIANNDTAVKQIDREIAARKLLSAEIRKKDIHKTEIETGKDAAKAVADEWKRGWEQTERLGRDAFTVWIENGTSAAEAIGKAFKKSVASAIFDITAKPIAFQLYTSIAGTPPTGANGVSALGNGINAGMGLNTLWGAGSQFATGATAGSSALGMTYANGVGMVGGDSLGALAAANGSWAGVSTATTAAASAEASAAAAEAAFYSAEAVAAGTSATAGAAAAGTGAAAGTTGLAAVPGWGWAALAVIAAFSLFGGSKGPALTGTGSATTDFDTAGKTTRTNNFGNSFDFQTAAADKYVKGLQDSYAASAKALGIANAGGTFGFGSNNQDGGQFGVGAKVGTANYASTDIKTSDAALALEASRAVFAALQGSALPKYLTGVFDGITASTATQDQIANVLNYAQSIKVLNDQLVSFPSANLKDLSLDAIKGLAERSGGLDKLGANLSGYYENYFSAEQKRTQTITNITRTLNDAGAMLTEADVAGASRDTFKALVDGQKLNTEEGVKAYAALLSVAGAFASITPSAEEAAKAVKDTADAAIKAAQDSSAAAIKAKTDNEALIKTMTGFDAAGLGAMMLDAAFNPQAGLTAAQNFGNALQASIQNTLVSSVVGQISQSIFDAVIVPIAAGAVVSTTVTDKVMEDAKKKLAALGTLFSSDDFKGSIKDFTASVSSLLPQIAALAPVSYSAAAAVDSVAASLASIADPMDKVNSIRDEATNKYLTAQRAVTQAQQTLANVLHGLVNSFQSVLDGLDGGGTPTVKLAGARQNFDDLTAKAQGGDSVAMSQLANSAKTFLDLSKGYSATIQDYRRDEAKVRAIMEQGLAAGKTRLSGLPNDMQQDDPLKAANTALQKAYIDEVNARNIALAMTAKLSSAEETLADRYVSALKDVGDPGKGFTTYFGQMMDTLSGKSLKDAAIKALTDVIPKITGSGNTLVSGVLKDLKDLLPGEIGGDFNLMQLADDALKAALPKVTGGDLDLVKESIKALENWMGLMPKGMEDFKLQDAAIEAITKILPKLSGEDLDLALQARTAIATILPSGTGPAFELATLAATALGNILPTSTGVNFELSSVAYSALKSLLPTISGASTIDVTGKINSTIEHYLPSVQGGSFNPAYLVGVKIDAMLPAATGGDFDPASMMSTAIGLMLPKITGGSSIDVTDKISTTIDHYLPSVQGGSFNPAYLVGVKIDAMLPAATGGDFDPANMMSTAIGQMLPTVSGGDFDFRAMAQTAIDNAMAGIISSQPTSTPTPTDPTVTVGGVSLSSSDIVAYLNKRVIDTDGMNGATGKSNAIGEAHYYGITDTQLDVLRSHPNLYGVASFDVGTNYVPRDMLAKIHEGEAVVPKAYNPAAGGGAAYNNDALIAELRLLREQNAVMGRDLQVALAKLALFTKNTADASDRTRQLEEKWDALGMPPNRAGL